MRRLTLFFALFLSSMLFSSAEPLAVGAAAPTLQVTTDTGAKLSLPDVYAKGYTLIYFYPKANTPGCTAQGCSLRDAYEVLTQKGVTVLGVSTDTVEAQRKFKEEQKFPFTLIADTEKALMKAFGQESLLGFAKRQAFLIDSSGKVVWRDLSASTKQQADDVLKALSELGVK